MSFEEKFSQQMEKAGKELEQLRDELRLKAHLLKMESKDEWESMEKKYQYFVDNKLPELKESSREASHEMKEKIQELSEEVKKGYKKLIDSIKH
jgi:gas vesicle protein